MGAVSLVVKIIGDTAGLDKALTSSTGQAKGFGSAIGGISPVMLGAAGATVVAGAAIVGMTDAAAKDRDEQNKLNAAIATATGSTMDYTEQVDKAIEAGQEKAFTDSDTRKGLQSLVTATGNVSQATELLTTAQDVARLAGVDLKTASDAVAKAHQGNDKALRSLVPGIKKGVSATDTLAEATRLAAGQADTYAASSEGMGAKGADAFAEIGETIGQIFLPILDEVLPALLPVIKQFGKLVEAILPIFVPLVKLLATYLGAVAKVLGIVVGWVIKLVTWLTKAIGKVGAFLDSINPFKNIELPSLPFLSSAAAPVAASAATRAGSSSATGSINITIQGALDPEATARQIRRILAGHITRTGGAGIGI